MSYNTDVCDHGPVAVGVAPDHQAAVGVDVIMLSISAGGAEVGAAISMSWKISLRRCFAECLALGALF